LRTEGSIGVIAPDSRAATILAELLAAGIEADPLDVEADSRVTVVPASSAKGLEFDVVVLVEPAEIVAGEPTRLSGLRRLYVVLTRAVTRLVIVRDQPLPIELSA
jgi:DNA helicase IV